MQMLAAYLAKSYREECTVTNAEQARDKAYIGVSVGTDEKLMGREGREQLTSIFDGSGV